MRLWSLHPAYLDKIGLVALWRETLLARHVLEGKTRGYRNHPQLNRFKSTADPVGMVNNYLAEIFNESLRRGFHFDYGKINPSIATFKICVNLGQIEYEYNHLLRKLEKRDPGLFEELKLIPIIEPNPIFTIVDGGVEDWEKQVNVE